MRAFTWQPEVWLTHGQVNRRDVIMPEEFWLRTEGYRAMIATVHRYSGGVKSMLALEGTDSPDGGWTEIESFRLVDSEPNVVILSATSQRSDPYRLWKLVRWHWLPDPLHATPELDGESQSFKIQVVLK